MTAEPEPELVAGAVKEVVAERDKFRETARRLRIAAVVLAIGIVAIAAYARIVTHKSDSTATSAQGTAVDAKRATGAAQAAANQANATTNATIRCLGQASKRAECLRQVQVKIPVAGPAGNPGTPGPVGGAGLPGATGSNGPRGPAGPKGDTGTQGLPGLAGKDGEPGQDGKPGPEGPAGPAGPSGQDGVSTTGAQGAQGTVGARGTGSPRCRGRRRCAGPEGRHRGRWRSGRRRRAGARVPGRQHRAGGQRPDDHRHPAHPRLPRRVGHHHDRSDDTMTTATAPTILTSIRATEVLLGDIDSSHRPESEVRVVYSPATRQRYVYAASRYMGTLVSMLEPYTAENPAAGYLLMVDPGGPPGRSA